MTCNNSLINIYPVDYKINIQLIKIEGTPISIISDFDLSYSQMTILDWDTINMTFEATKSLLTGYFTINRNAIIRNYRIVKAYIKGFQLDSNEYTINTLETIKADNKKYKHKLLDEVKNMIKDLYNIYQSYSKNENKQIYQNLAIEKELRKYYPKGSQEYKIMTKSVHLTQIIINDLNEEELKFYLECASDCKYFEINDLGKKVFESLKSYLLGYESESSFINYFYPKMENISLSRYNFEKNIIHYPLKVTIGEYYRHSSNLEDYYFNMKIKVKDLKLFNKNGSMNFVFYPDSQTINIINMIDSKIEELYNTFINQNNISSNCLKFEKKLEKHSTLIGNIDFQTVFKNIILRNNYCDENTESTGDKKNIYNPKKYMKYCINEMKKTKFTTLNQLKKMNLKKDDILKLRMKIDGIHVVDDIIDESKIFKYDIKIDISI
jgi:hypothetical protein